MYPRFAMEAIVLLFLYRVIREIVREEIDRKESLNGENKSFEKTIKLRTDTLLIPSLSTCEYAGTDEQFLLTWELDAWRRITVWMRSKLFGMMIDVVSR